MTKAVKVLKLDFLTVKPYCRFLFVLLAVGFLFGIGNKEPYIIPPMFMIWALFLASYPFSIGEKNSLDKLYGTFSLKRKDIVTGRYMFSLAGSVLFLAVSVVIVFLSAVIIEKNIEIEELLFVVCIGFLIFSVVASFQVPIFFKFGYNKAKLLTYLPLLAIAFIVPLANLIPADSAIGRIFNEIGKIIEEKTYLAYVMMLSISFIVLYISYIISRSIYEKRDI
ncbi:MAG TPA: ABC-2 transporter permease [Pseudobacteroides sp.]|mgnify:CR=1 FL=1|nr:ABC-2 transporter permease [Pseudobacteroides sp.]